MHTKTPCSAENLRVLTGRSRRPDGGRPVASTSRGDRVDELRLRLEARLVAQALPELDDEPLPVEVAVEVEQERLDPPLGAAVVRIRADRDRGAVARAPQPA